MKSYWQNLQDRERIILIAGTLVATVLLIYLLVLAPLSGESARLRESVKEQQQLLGWMKSAASEVTRLRGASSPASSSATSLLSLVDGTTRKAGLAKQIKRIQPDGDSTVHVWFESVGFDQVLLWLGKIIEQHGVVTKDLSVEKIEKKTEVNVRLVLQGKNP